MIKNLTLKKWLSSPAINSFLKNLLAIFLAIPIGFLITLIFSRSQIVWFEENVLAAILSYIYKFLCAMAMPLVFFSIIALIVHLQMNSNSENRLIKLFTRYLFSAIVCIGIGILVYFIFKDFNLLPTDYEIYQIDRNFVIGKTLGEIIENLAPSNIIEPFISSTPFPAILMAVILGCALLRTKKEQISYLYKGILGLRELFTAALEFVYNCIPFVAFLCQLYLFLEYLTTNQDIDPLPWKIGLYSLIPLFLAFIFYAIRLKIAGISIKDFLHENKELLIENFLIGSNKDAINYNCEKLSQRFSISKEALHEQLELGGVINMDGDCAILSVVLLLECLYINRSLTVVDFILMAIIIIGVCTGAPNEPGTFLIGASALMKFFGISSLIFSDIVFIEAILAIFYAFQTSLGDIVTLTIFNKKYHISNNDQLDKVN